MDNSRPMARGMPTIACTRHRKATYQANSPQVKKRAEAHNIRSARDKASSGNKLDSREVMALLVSTYILVLII